MRPRHLPALRFVASDTASGNGAILIGPLIGLRIESEGLDLAPEYESDAGEFVDELDVSAGLFFASIVYYFQASSFSRPGRRSLARIR